MSEVGRRVGAALTLGFVARAALVVIGLWVLAQLLWAGRNVLFVAFFAILVASFLSIFVDALVDRGMARGLAAPLVMAVWLAALVSFAVFVWPTLQSQLGLVQAQLPAALDEIERWLSQRAEALSRPLGGGDDLLVELRRRMNAEIAGLIGGTLPLLNTVIGALSGLVVVAFAAVFLAIEPALYRRGLIALMPAGHRANTAAVLGSVGTTLRRWMAGTAIGMVLIATLSTAGLWLLGIPAPLALGVIAGLLEFIPFLGPVLSAIPAIGVALSVSFESAVYVLLLYIVIQGFESNLIVPLLMKGMVKLPPALTILVQSLMAVLFGFLGLLLAVPLLATTLVLVRRLYVEPIADRA